MRAPTLVAIALVGLLLAAAQAAVPTERVLFDETFNGMDAARFPAGWLPLQGKWLLAQRDTTVLRQDDEGLTGDSWILALWANYTVVVKLQAEEGNGAWGAGVLAYHDTAGRGYRLRLGEGHVYLEKTHGREVRALASAEARVSRGKWFSLRLNLVPEPGATSLRGRVWPSEAEEPKEWALRARDEQFPLLGGTIGLWTGNCAARFAYLTAKRNDAGAGRATDLLYGTDFSEADQGQLPLSWKATGGVWARDTVDKTAVLRQMVQQSGPRYDDNAMATVQWSGYTVSATAMAHPGPGKWGLGLVAYFGARGGNYRLRTLDNKLYLVKRQPGGKIAPLSATGIETRRGRWYNLRFSVENLANGTRLLGKLWDADAAEPEGWMVSALDAAQPLTEGAPGLWSFGCAADFDNFTVKTSLLSALNGSP